MNIDLLATGVGITSFVIFLGIQVITFRFLSPEKLLKSLLACIFCVVMLPVVLMAILFSLKASDAPVAAWVLAALLALLISGLTSFVYISCIFGPYETSVRMRLVREIAHAGPQGVFLEGILRQYNSDVILKVRLRRLVGSGDIVEKDGLYQPGHKRNFFFVFDQIAQVIKNWIHG